MPASTGFVVELPSVGTGDGLVGRAADAVRALASEYGSPGPGRGDRRRSSRLIRNATPRETRFPRIRRTIVDVDRRRDDRREETPVPDPAGRPAGRGARGLSRSRSTRQPASALQWNLTNLRGTLDGAVRRLVPRRPRSAPWSAATATLASIDRPDRRHGGVGQVTHFNGLEEVHAERSRTRTFSGAQVRGVSCPSTEFCAAMSRQGYVYASTSPAGGAPAWAAVALQGEHKPRVHVYGVSCPSTSLCVGVASGGRIVTSTRPVGATAWNVSQLGAPLELTGVSCPSESLCVAVSSDGNIISTTDPGGGAPTWVAAAPAGGYRGPPGCLLLLALALRHRQRGGHLRQHQPGRPGGVLAGDPGRDAAADHRLLLSRRQRLRRGQQQRRRHHLDRPDRRRRRLVVHQRDPDPAERDVRDLLPGDGILRRRRDRRPDPDLDQPVRRHPAREREVPQGPPPPHGQDHPPPEARR